MKVEFYPNSNPIKFIVKYAAGPTIGYYFNNSDWQMAAPTIGFTKPPSHQVQSENINLPTNTKNRK
ncbi:MAG: hypothetical protein FWD86_02220 [Firmicutes bacterium]|nr:hypothetical protein [Bacillota bacterium]